LKIFNHLFNAINKKRGLKTPFGLLKDLIY